MKEGTVLGGDEIVILDPKRGEQFLPLMMLIDDELKGLKHPPLNPLFTAS